MDFNVGFGHDVSLMTLWFTAQLTQNIKEMMIG